MKRAAHSVSHMFSSLCLFVALVVSHFGFEGRTVVLIVSVPGHCLPFTLHCEKIIQDDHLERYLHGFFIISLRGYKLIN